MGEADEGTRISPWELVALGGLQVHHPGDVEMPEQGLGPVLGVGERQRLGEEPGRGAGTVDPLEVRVDDVGLVGGEQLGTLAPRDRHREEPEAGLLDGVEQVADQRVRTGAEHGDLATERSDSRTGEGGHVDDEVRLGLFDGEVDAVDQREPAFRIGVVDLDELTDAGGDDVPTERAVAVLRGVERQDDLALHAHQDEEHELGDGADRTVFVHEHVVHGRIGLPEEATRVEGDRLAEQDDRALAGHLRVVDRVDASGLFRRSVVDGEEAAEAREVARHVPLVELTVEIFAEREGDLVAELLLEEGARARHQHPRRALGAAQVADLADPAADEGDSVPDEDLLLDAVLVVALVGHDGELGVRLLGAGGGGALDRVVAQAPPLGDELDVVAEAPVLGTGNGDRRRAGQVAALPEEGAGEARGVPEVVRLEVAQVAAVHDDELPLLHGEEGDVVAFAGDDAIHDRLVEEAQIVVARRQRVEGAHLLAIDDGEQDAKQSVAGVVTEQSGERHDEFEPHLSLCWTDSCRRTLPGKPRWAGQPYIKNCPQTRAVIIIFDIFDLDLYIYKNLIFA